jgi:BlaI family transcriptional regulator, penicillinase repressor
MLEKQHTAGTLSRRERQIMDVLYRCGKVSAAEVQAQMPNPPGYSAVRAMLRVLEDKGHIRHIADGLKYLYVPTVPREKAKRSAIRHVLDTFSSRIRRNRLWRR